MSRAVMRLGGERVCLVVPIYTERSVVEKALGLTTTRSATANDDATDGMGMYQKGGAVVTYCGQFALYDLQGELDVDCLRCLANLGAI